MMKHDRDPALSAMTMDILGNVLSRADNPGSVGEYVTEEIRELTGARCMVLIQCLSTPTLSVHRVVSVNPPRRRAWAESPQVNVLFDVVHRMQIAAYWRGNEPSEVAGLLQQEGFELSMAIPLNVGEIRVGAMLLLGLPDEHHVSSVFGLLDNISDIVALVLRNAFLFERQEQIIQERTAALQTVNERLRAELVVREQVQEELQEQAGMLEEEIEERKQAEKTIAVTQRLLQDFADNSTSLMYALDTEGRFLLVNRRLESVFGVPREDLIGKTRDAALPVEIGAAHRANDLEVMRKRQPIIAEEENDEKDGKHTYLSTKFPLSNPQGDIYGVGGISSDITERKRAELALQSLNEELEQRVAERTAELEAINTELKQEMAARFSQQQFLEALLESTEAGIVACDADGILTLFNRKSREFHGLPQTPIPADQWAEHYDLFLPDGKTPMRTEEVPLFRALQGERVVNDEMMIIPKGGESKVLLASGQLIHDKDGRKIGAVVAMHDITERKRVEETLRASEEKYRSVVENIGMGVTMISPDMEVLSLNTCMKNWFPNIDVSRRPICYESFIDPPRDGLCIDCPTYRTLQDGEVHDAVIETPAGDRTLFFRVLSSPIRDKDGKVMAATEMVEDVTEKQVVETELRRYREHLEELIAERTAELEKANGVLLSELGERKRAEEALGKSEARFRRLAENARDVIYRMSLPDGAYEYMSPAATELFGYAPEEFYTSPGLIREIIHPDWHAYFEEEWAKLLQGEMPPMYEFQLIHKSGDVRWVNQRNILVRDDAGRIVAIEGIITDITARKSSEEELQRMNEELEQRVAERTAELARKNDELERMNKLFVGRELRMMELKERIGTLEQALQGGNDFPKL